MVVLPGGTRQPGMGDHLHDWGRPMPIRHLPRLDPERWYIIDVDHGAEEDRPSWQHRALYLHGPTVTASASWTLLDKHGFGYGFQFGRNGDESDLGLNIYAGRLASLWLRIQAPFTRWARVSKERDPEHWYDARHTSIRFFPYDGCILNVEIDNRANGRSSKDPWWRNWRFRMSTLMGRADCETIDGDTGTVQIPLPEGNYEGVWTKQTRTWKHRRPLGTWRDRLLGPRAHRSVDLKIETGIPIEGKGENSYDCGMDGLFGCGGATVEDAVAHAVGHVLKYRRSYGGPHNLPRPMTVSEAAEWPPD